MLVGDTVLVVQNGQSRREAIMSYSDRMADILLADFERWQSREQDESNSDSSRASIAHGSMDRRYMRGMGLIPQNESKRDYPNTPARVSYSNSERCEGTSPNVRVYRADGSVSVKPSASFRSTTPKNRVRVVREQHHRMMARDISSSQGDYD